MLALSGAFNKRVDNRITKYTSISTELLVHSRCIFDVSIVHKDVREI